MVTGHTVCETHSPSNLGTLGNPEKTVKKGGGHRIRRVGPRDIGALATKSCESSPLKYIRLITRSPACHSTHLTRVIPQVEHSRCVESSPVTGQYPWHLLTLCGRLAPVCKLRSRYQSLPLILTCEQSPRCAKVQANSPAHGQGVSTTSSRSDQHLLTYHQRETSRT